MSKPAVQVIAAAIPRERYQVASDLVSLTKPRVLLMVLAATLLGYFEALRGPADYARMAHLVIGTLLAAGGTAVLYIGVYTPLKLRTASCMLVGAVPGALPPVTGWLAAGGDLGLGAAVLFGILFLWQLPHTLAIARLYADDYARGGVRVLPVVDPHGTMSERQIISSTLALIAVSVLPAAIGLSGVAYFATACALGLGLLGAGLAHANTVSTASARRVLMASLLYLPLLLAALALDKP